MEFIAITVSNNDELRSHWFGSNIGEEFYHTYNILNDAIVPFRCFSVLKKKGKYCLIFFFNKTLLKKFLF
jgi:hypothetical protein